MSDENDRISANDIAIIGMVGRFPGAKNLHAFWDNLRNGVESIRQFTDAELQAEGISPAMLNNPKYVNAHATLDDIELFDAAFFGITPREAEITDPQHRLFLECAWEALEDAGYDPERYEGAIGVFASTLVSSYMLSNLSSNHDLLESIGALAVRIGNDRDFLPTRVSYKLNLTGPSICIQTACSSSLVGCHLACQNLLDYQCDIALVGGVALPIPQKAGYIYQEESIFSPDGHCRAFDAQAHGTVMGSGIGIVVLKRLEDALEDGDVVRAVIKGSAINNDGALKVGYTAPSVEGQAAVIAMAHAVARVEAETISYIEAHGTGTALGDPIEIAALTQVFRESTTKKGFCAIGSVKTNIGHLDPAAGIAGLIKTVLALEHRLIPPSLNYEAPNPAIDFANSPFYVNAKRTEWKPGRTPRRAGVSSFAVGGTNAHVVLEEAPMRPAAERCARPQQLLVLSAKTATALEQATSNLIAYLQQHPDYQLADVAYTLQVGRRGWEHRRMLVCRDLEDAAAALQARDPKRVYSSAQKPTNRPIAFMFPGQGAQYVNMGRDLYEAEPVFREHVDRCAELLRPHLGLDLRAVLYPDLRIEDRRWKIEDTESSILYPLSSTLDLDQTEYAQPALFVVEYALARLWMGWGIYPQAMIGHSIGEYVAACLAGVFSLEDALALVSIRGRLMQTLPPGAMLTIPLPWAEVAPLLDNRVSCAAINAPAMCVVAGPADALDAAQERFTAHGVDCRQLHTSHAFHSSMMDPIARPFFEQVQKIRLQPPQIPYLSNVTGTWMMADDATDPGYWVKHLRQTVQFSAGVTTLLETANRILLEVGPGRTLSTFVHQHMDGASELAVLTSIGHPQEQRSDVEFVLSALGRLWLAGAAIDWKKVYAHERRHRLPLPTYPFERRRYWVAPSIAPAAQRSYSIVAQHAPKTSPQLLTPIWKETLLPSPFRPTTHSVKPLRWVVFSDACGLGQNLVARLKHLKQDVIVVRPGSAFRRLNDSEYTIVPARPEDYRAICDIIASWEPASTRIVHLWSVTVINPLRSLSTAPVQDNDPGLHSLVLLARALGRQTTAGAPDLTVITNHAQDVVGTELLRPDRATMLGLTAAAAQEYSNIRCRSVDVLYPASGTFQDQKLSDLLIAEIAVQLPEAVIAYRSNHRWVRTLEAAYREEAEQDASIVRKAGVYLLTDGLSDIGIDLAASLASSMKARLILIGHTAFPDRDEWAQRLVTPADHDDICRKIRRLQALEEAGAQVMIVRTDVSDPHALQTVVSQAEQRFGRIHGVIHEVGQTDRTGEHTAPETDLAGYERLICARTSELQVLAAALDGLEMDFVLLVSSLPLLSSQAPCSLQKALGSLIESYVRKHNRGGIVRWLGVTWDDWLCEEHSQHYRLATAEDTRTAAAVEMIRNILALDLTSHIIVSSEHPQTDLSRSTGARLGADQLESRHHAPALYERPDLPSSYVAPENPLEQALADIWRHLLGIAHVGVHDNFFELGGHSLLATQALSRIHDTLKVDLSLSSFFEAATVAELARQIELHQHREQRKRVTSIAVTARDGTLALSFAQQRMWLLDQLDPGNPLYNLPHAMQLIGHLDLAALKLGVNDVVRRHELLRTTFPVLEGSPTQMIVPSLKLPLPVLDLRGCPSAVREAQVRRMVSTAAQYRFDLAAEPLVRVCLLRLTDTEHVLLLNMHHIISDGWSVGVLVNELIACYVARMSGAGDRLPELPIQYADYAAWQRQRLQGTFLESQLAYWKAHLSDTPVLQLPTDHPRPVVQTYHSDSLPLRYSPTLSNSLRSLSRQVGGTLFMMQLTAFATFLSRITHQTDFCVGSLVANRNQPEIEGLIGFFVNNLAIRVDLSGKPSVVALLARIREATLGAYDHQDVPFELVLEALQPARNASYTPLFQVMCVLQNFPQLLQAVPGLALQPLQVSMYRSGFDLTFWLWEEGDGLTGQLEYNPDLFDPATITRLAGQLEVLLKGMVADPTRRISDLALLSDAEKQQLLLMWTGSPTVYPHEQCIHILFEAQVERTPAAIAVADADCSLTYAELNRRANRIGHYVQKLGVEPGKWIGLCLPRSQELVIGALGILKAGAGFVPLDPTYPPERLLFMLADAGVPALITIRRFVADLTLPRVQVICLDTDCETLAGMDTTNPGSAVSPDHPVYTIYTSGSTGQPKGAGVYHRGFVNLVSWFAHEFMLTSNDRILLMTSFSFDLTQKNIFAPLITGGTVYLAPPGYYDAHALRAMVADNSITRLNCTPSAFYPLVEQEHHHTWTKLASLRSVFLGGEPIAVIRLIDWLTSDDCQAEVVNTYGPTECTDVVAFYRLDHPKQFLEAPVPIGKPISNIQLLILDSYLNLVPLGTIGELCVAGVGVGMGYANDSMLTSAKFVPNPFAGDTETRRHGDTETGDRRSKIEDRGSTIFHPPSSIPHPLLPNTQHPTPNTRLYRTGDLVRALPDGTIVFVGRVDDQVKVRGYRIELGEVEALLAQHPSVHECAVLVRDDTPGGQRLVAYVVPRREQGTGDRGQEGTVSDTAFLSPVPSHLSPGELRDFLKTKLPDYMVPSAFVLLDALPLTPNGKLDRRALPKPDARHSSANDAIIPPRTPIEEQLAQIWSTVLDVAQVGVDNNFFALGGHSLLATQVITRLRETFQVELPLRVMFEAPTVARLAERIVTARADHRGLDAAAQPSARSGTVPLSFAQQRLWFLDQLMPGTTTYTIQLPVRLSGTLDVAAFHASFSAIVRRHETLRTTFATVDGQPVQVISAHALLPLVVVNLQALEMDAREAVAAQLIRVDAQRPFDLTHGPLVRVALLRLAQQEHLVLLNMHHIISDAWSLGVLLQELTTVYTAFSAGQPSPLPDLPIQYADFACWQRQWLQGSGVRGQGDREQGEADSPSPIPHPPSPIQAQLAYWTRQLSGALPVLELPTDYSRPAVQTSNGTQQAFGVSPSMSVALQALSRQEGATLFMMLLAAFQVLLGRYSGQDDVLVGSPIAGRTQRATEDLIGCFVNTLVLRADLRSAPTFRELLRQVREVCLGAYAHQDLPFERLVEELHPARDLSRHPLFQVMFALQNAPVRALDLPNLTLRPLPIDTRTTKFDLTVVLAETAVGLAGAWEYNTDLFDAATITRMIAHFQVLLEGIVANPGQRLADLPLLTATERQLLLTWNATQATYPDDACIHDLVGAQAARAPDAVAVVFDGPGVRGQGSGGRGQQATAQTPLPPPAGGGTERDRGWASAPPPTGGGTEGGRGWASALLSPQSSVLSPQQLTYAELNRCANQLAHHLQARGVGPEVRVGICLERSPELIVGLLAILKAGGAYVPLDPAYPPTRQAFMLEDSRAVVLITTTGETDKETRRLGDKETEYADDVTLSPPHLVTPSQRAVVRLDADWPTIAAAPPNNPACRNTPDHLAYVIYTSGSTGRPKGVRIEHRALLNLSFWHQGAFHVSPQDRATQLAGLAFDAAVWELWPYLAAGASITMPDEETRRSPLRLRDWLITQAITISFLPTPLAEQVLDLDWPAELALRTLLTGGDTLHRAPPATLPFVLVNNYGPTENTVVTTTGTVPPAVTPARAPAIGRPISNVQVYVLDRYLTRVPIGVWGELHIGGASLARDYLGRPELTAEHFIPNPFGGVKGDRCWVTGTDSPNTQHPTPNTRLYRTGDLARYRPDGAIEYLGRHDAQVKVRGYRIELGEVEAVLAQHEAVRYCAVVAREDAPGDKRLVAYVVQESGARSQESTGSQAPDSLLHSAFCILHSGELHAFLKERLPEYMVPSMFVLLEALPLTPNGKLDRRALPAPDAARLELATTFVAPRTPTEQVVAEIWSDVLGVARVGVDDNFFALGGHSLLATQVITRLRDACAVELPLRVLFAAPTMAALAAHVAAERQVVAAPLPPIRPVARTAPLPLSFAQQRLWFLDQLAPGNAAYNIPAPVRLSGTLDVVALHDSLNTIVWRHEALRTTFANVDGQPVQVIAPVLPLPLVIVDLQAAPDAARDAQARRLATAEARRPFDLRHGPLLRATLVRLSPADHMMLFTMHHIVSDGWSMGVFVRELAALYSAFAAGQPSPLLPLPIQYADFAVWQQQWLQGAVLETQLAYWRQQLEHNPPALNLPTDRPRPALQTFHGAHNMVVVPLPLTQMLATLSHREGGTLFMTLLAAFQALLGRYTAQDDVLVGSPIAGRTQRATEDLIGCFVNTLVLRADLSGNPSFRELLGRVREVCLGAYAHQDVSFEQLVELLQPERDLSRPPLFQVMFVLQNAPMQALDLPGLALRLLPVESGTAKLDLTVALTETAAGLAGAWEYNTDLFDAATITRMIAHFQILLDGIVADPDQRLADLPLLTTTERQALVTWNATEVAYPQHACIHDLVATQAVRTPDAVALVFNRLQPGVRGQGSGIRGQGDKETRPALNGNEGRQGDKEIRPNAETQHPSPIPHQLTYYELNRRANQLAHHLHALGVGPEIRVGICVERSPDLVVGLLSILKAGGAYVPLDPSYPITRLAFMLADSQVAVLVTQESLIARLPDHTARIVCLDAHGTSLAARSEHLINTAQSDHLAYVIYTSGSTGTPKGVAITHRSVVALLTWARTTFTPAQIAGVLASTSICFDLSVFELFVPLSWGGTLILVENILHLPSALAAHAVTLINTVPSALVELLRIDGIPASTRTINLAGEPLPLRLVQQLYEQPAIEQVVNLYGPSEDTTYSTWAVIPKESAALPTIGQPIANTHAYLLDAKMQPVPIGVAGELYLGGAGLARGYLNRPDLTAERFVPNPFGGVLGEGCWVLEDSAPNTQHPTPNTRLYRTGDLACYRRDGSIEFIGRIDQQVKIRGFRIELGEIETALNQYPDVHACVVLAREDIPGDKRLVAYLVMRTEGRGLSGPDSSVLSPQSSVLSELRAFLQTRLPNYMIPSVFVMLSTLPLTPNGKPNCRALPAPDATTSRLDAPHRAPRDPLELRLTQIWEAVLALRPVGITDNFFDLGGHSLLTVRLLAQIEHVFSQRLPLAALFQDPTIEKLAQRLRQQGDLTPSSPIVALQFGAGRRPFFCVHPVSGSVLCYLELARALGTDQPFYGLQAIGLEGEQPLLSQVSAMGAAYVAALRAVQPQGPYQLGGWSVGGVIAFEMARQLHAQGCQVALLALLDTLAPIPGQWQAPAADQDAELLIGFVQDLAAQAGQTLDRSTVAIEQCAPEQAMCSVVAQAQALGLLPLDIGIAQIEDRLAVFKANLAAVRSYVPVAAPCPIVLFRASDSAAARATDPQLGWGTLTAGALEVVEVAGDHYTMVAQPHVQQLAQRLRSYLEG